MAWRALALLVVAAHLLGASVPCAPETRVGEARLHAADATTPGHLHLPGERHATAADASHAAKPKRARLRAPCTCGCGDGAPPAAGGSAAPLACAPPPASLRLATARPALPEPALAVRAVSAAPEDPVPRGPGG